MCGMEFELEETVLQSVNYSDEVSSSDLQRLLEIFDRSNRRLNAFLDEKVLLYQKDETAVTMFPIASFIIARVGEEIAGYASFFDNYLIGIFIADSFSHCRLEQTLLGKVKETLPRGIETIVFMKNSSLLELYLENGFNVSTCRSCWRCNEITVTLVHDGCDSSTTNLIASDSYR